MFTLQVHVSGIREAEATMEDFGSGLNERQVNTLVGRAAMQATREHLYGLANTRHRPGVALNFYKDAGDAVSNSDLSDGAEVRIDKAGIAQRYHGGLIEAVNYSHLWIPIAPESEGRSAAEFKGLVKIVNRQTDRGVAILPGPDPKTGKPSTKFGTVLFALVPDLYQDPDPTVLPTDLDYVDAIEQAVQDVLGDVTNLGRQL